MYCKIIYVIEYIIYISIFGLLLYLQLSVNIFRLFTILKIMRPIIRVLVKMYLKMSSKITSSKSEFIEPSFNESNHLWISFCLKYFSNCLCVTFFCSFSGECVLTPEPTSFFQKGWSAGVMHLSPQAINLFVPPVFSKAAVKNFILIHFTNFNNLKWFFLSEQRILVMFSNFIFYLNYFVLCMRFFWIWKFNIKLKIV